MFTTVRFNKPEKVFSRLTGIEVNDWRYKDFDLAIALTKLLESLHNYFGEDADPDNYIEAKLTPQIGDKFYVLKDGEAQAFKALIEQVKISIQAAYDKGKQDGKQALIMLNNGDITLDEFNKQNNPKQ